MIESKRELQKLLTDFIIKKLKKWLNTFVCHFYMKTKLTSNS